MLLVVVTWCNSAKLCYVQLLEATVYCITECNMDSVENRLLDITCLLLLGATVLNFAMFSY